METKEDRIKIMREALFMPDGKTPKCSICGEPMKKAVDKITKKLSDYEWELDCECARKYPALKNLRLCIG
jgi:hypothetical protein